MTVRLVVMGEELAQERNDKKEALAKEESKLKKEFEKEQRIMKNIIQECQVKWQRERWWERMFLWYWV